MTITVACVMKTGGRYDEDWVRRLYEGVARHLTIPYQFVCLSDVPLQCATIPLVGDLPGWWSKMELFRPGLFDGPVLYLDLDSVIVGSLNEFFNYRHRFTMAHEFYRPKFGCSTAMAWEGDFSFLWDKLLGLRNPGLTFAYYDSWTPDQRIGDQAMIEDLLKEANCPVEYFRDLFGERSVASYKVHCRKKLDGTEKVVAFHGSLKPNDLLHIDWIKENWR